MHNEQVERDEQARLACMALLEGEVKAGQKSRKRWMWVFRTAAIGVLLAVLWLVFSP